MAKYIDLSKLTKEEIDDILRRMDNNEVIEELKLMPTIGFDDVTFKLICKKKKEILLNLIYFVTDIKLNIDDCQFSDAELVDGINLKTQICDFYISASNGSYKYGIDIESEQKTNTTDKGLFARALLTASKIYTNLHEKSKIYKDNKRCIVIYFYNDKYNQRKTLNRHPVIKTKLVDVNLKSRDEHDNITLYRINVREAKKYGFKNDIKNDKILVEALKVLSTREVDKYLDSEYEVIKTMAEEIKKVNENEVEHMNSIMKELAELRYDMDMGSAYYGGVEEGHKKGVEEGIKQGKEEGIKQGLKQGKEEGIKQGLKQGKEEGIKQGKEEGKRDIVSALYESGLSIDELAKRLNMSTKQIEGLLK